MATKNNWACGFPFVSQFHKKSASCGANRAKRVSQTLSPVVSTQMLSNCLLTLVNLGGLSFLLARTDAQLSVEQTIKPVTVSVAQVVTLTPDFGGPTSRPKTWYVWKVGSVSSEHGVLRSTLQGFVGSWN